MRIRIDRKLDDDSTEREFIISMNAMRSLILMLRSAQNRLSDQLLECTLHLSTEGLTNPSNEGIMGIRVTKMISSPKSVFPKEEMVVDHILLLFKCEENYEVNEFRVKDNEVATATDIINEITKKIPVPA